MFAARSPQQKLPVDRSSRSTLCIFAHQDLAKQASERECVFVSASGYAAIDAILGRGIGTLLPLNHASTHASLIVYTDRGHHRRNRPGPRPTWASKVGDAPAEAEIEGTTTAVRQIASLAGALR